MPAGLKNWDALIDVLANEFSNKAAAAQLVSRNPAQFSANFLNFLLREYFRTVRKMAKFPLKIMILLITVGPAQKSHSKKPQIMDQNAS